MDSKLSSILVLLVIYFVVYYSLYLKTNVWVMLIYTDTISNPGCYVLQRRIYCYQNTSVSVSLLWIKDKSGNWTVKSSVIWGIVLTPWSHEMSALVLLPVYHVLSVVIMASSTETKPIHAVWHNNMVGIRNKCPKWGGNFYWFSRGYSRSSPASQTLK